MILAVALSVLFGCVSSEGIVVRNLNLHSYISSTCVHVYLHGLFWMTIINLSLLSLGLQLISLNAKSVNASEGTQVNFTCQT